MKSRKTARALAGIFLVAAGFWLVFPKAYRERTYLIPAAGCRLETTIFEKKEGPSQGTVVLFPGLAANNKIMAFLAPAFAAQNFRVVAPVLPGPRHGPAPLAPA